MSTTSRPPVSTTTRPPARPTTTVGPATTTYGFWLVGGLLVALGLAGILLTAGQFRRDLRTEPAESAPVAADLTT